MSNFDNLDAFENAFRNNIEKGNVTVPPNVWPMVNSTTLASHLAKHKVLNLWLTAFAGLMTLGFGITSFLLLNAPKSTPSKHEVVFTTKYDTVYITKVEKVFVNMPDREEKLIAKTTENKTLNSESNLVIIDKNVVEEHLTIQQVLNNNIDKTKENETLIIQENSVEKDSDFMYLQPHQFALQTPKIVVPSIKDQLKTQEVLTTNQPKNTTKKQIVSTLGFDLYLLPENNYVDIVRNDKKAFDYANQGSRGSKAIGARVSIGLGDRWSLLTGVEFSELRLEENEKSLNFTAENFFGIPSYLYRTALGTIQIPNNNLASDPKVGSTLRAESKDPLTSGFVRSNLGFRYEYFSKSFLQQSKTPVNIALYAQFGGTLTIPLKQDVALSLAQPNNVYTLFNTNDIQNQRYNYGLNAGLGVKSEIGKFGLFLEPSLSQAVTSLVKEMPIKTYLRSVGVKMGLSWRIK